MGPVFTLLWVGFVIALWVGIVAGVWAIVSTPAEYSPKVSQTTADE